MKFFQTRYFEDYVKVKVPGKRGGKERTDFVYAGDYRRLDITDEWWTRLKIVYILLMILYVMLFLYMAFWTVSSSFIVYVSVPVIVMVYPIYFMCYGAVCYALYPRNLTLRQYREGIGRIFFGSLAAVVDGVLILGAELIFYFTNGQPAEERVKIFGFAAVLVIAAVILATAKDARKYQIIENTDVDPELKEKVKKAKKEEKRKRKLFRF